MFKKFKTMSKEKEINIEDGNVQETVQNENNEQTTQNENTEENQNTDNKAEEGDNNTDAADKKAEEIDPLTKAQQEVEELKKQLLYKTAEFENYRKRTLKEKAELILNGGEKTVAAILPILDDFERAIADKSEDPKAIKEGVQMIFNKFTKTLEGLGFEVKTDKVLGGLFGTVRTVKSGDTDLSNGGKIRLRDANGNPTVITLTIV